VKTAKESNAFMLFLMIYSFAVSIPIGALRPHVEPPVLVALVTVLTFGVPSVAVVLKAGARWREIMPLRWIGWKNLLFVIALVVFVQPLMMSLSALMAAVFGNEVANTVGGLASSTGLGGTFLLVVVLPSLFEEIAFRGVIFSGYMRGKLLPAVLINGLFFGMMHLNLQQFPYTFCMGALFACLVYYTRSVLTGIVAHFAVNGVQLLLLAIGAAGDAPPVGAAAAQAAGQAAAAAAQRPEGKPELIAALILFVIAQFVMPLFIWVFWRFVKHNKKRNQNAAPEPAEDMQGRTFDWAFWSVIALYVYFCVMAYLL